MVVLEMVQIKVYTKERRKKHEWGYHTRTFDPGRLIRLLRKVK